MLGKVYLARHGETEWNRERRLQGSQDIPLSKIGKAQSEKLAHKLSHILIDTIITSDLKRAYQTGQIVRKQLHVPILRNKNLNERFYGKLEGKIWSSKKSITAKDGAQPYKNFSDRIIRELSEILASYQHKNILIICHGGVLRVMLEYFRGAPSISGNIGYELPNAALYSFRKEGAGWVEEDFS